MNEALLVPFLKGEGPDDKGRTIEEIHSWDNARLEATHDYIQWIFPLKLPSAYNLAAPLLNKDIIEIIQNDFVCRNNFQESFEIMLKFYGMMHDINEDGVHLVGKNEDFEGRSQFWLTPNNHNLKRISRILECLMTVGHEEQANALFGFLKHLHMQNAGRMGPHAFNFWKHAMRQNG
jgi:hypothetical protein